MVQVSQKDGGCGTGVPAVASGGGGGRREQASDQAKTQGEWDHFEHDQSEKKFIKRPRLADGSLGEPAFIEYTLPGWGIADLHETFVPPLYRGKGVAERLARETFEFCKSVGLRILPSCTYLAGRFLGRNPDLLAGTLAKVDSESKVRTVPPLVRKAQAKRDPGIRRSSRKKRIKVDSNVSNESEELSKMDGAQEEIVFSSRARDAPLVPWDLSLGNPRSAVIHIMPFLLPTTYCDADHPNIVALARKIIPCGCDILEAASRVRNYCRFHIKYVLDKKDRRASDTLSSGLGMCTNIANLQVAILRAAGIPAGYCLVHITKETFKEMVMPEMYKTISETTLHCFCASYDGDTGFLYFDATEAFKGHPSQNFFLQESFVSGETQFKGSWLRGPFTPVQANLDHLLAHKFPKKIPDDVRKREFDHLKNL